MSDDSMIWNRNSQIQKKLYYSILIEAIFSNQTTFRGLVPIKRNKRKQKIGNENSGGLCTAVHILFAVWTAITPFTS